MAATTYTTDLGIKKIGTGLEAGTWGQSTSQNLERLSDKMGRSVSLDLIAMPTGSTSAVSGPTPGTAVWILLNSSDSEGATSDDGAEGRSFMVEVTDGTEITASVVQMNIRGATSSTNVARTYAIWNNLTSANLDIDCGGGTYRIRNGFTAMITTVPNTTGGLAGGAAGVQNVMSAPQFDKMILTDNPTTITYANPGSIDIPTNNARALAISDPQTTDVVTFNTQRDRIELLSSTQNEVDLSGDGTIPFEGRVMKNSAIAYKIVNDSLFSGTSQALLTVDTQTLADKVIVGETGLGVDLKVWGDVELDDSAHNLVIPDALDPAFSILSTDATEYLNILSSATDNLRRLDIKVTAEVPDIYLTGTDGYILGTPPADPAIPADGYGLRNNSGQMEIKSSTGDWTEAWNSEQVSGTGTYFEGDVTTIALSTDHTIAHNLVTQPRMFTCHLVCTSADAGYAIGDEVSVAGLIQPHNGNEATTLYADITNIGFMTGSAFRGTVAQRTTGAATNIDIAKWDLRFRAWK